MGISLRTARGALAVLAAASLAAGCASSKSTSSSAGTSGHAAPKIPMATAVGKGEGQLNIIVWAGYAESGANDPKVDWVHPFEKQTGCNVNVKVGNTSDEMVQLMRTGQYDGVSASGDATLRLIYGGDVAPVNTALVPNYATISPFLKNGKWNSVNGQMYGIPHGWGANLLMWNPSKVSGNLDSWSAVFDQAAANKGKVTAYDSPIYIADAALYLMATQPSLGIKDPYSLTIGTARRSRGAAEEAERRRRRVLGRLHQGGAGLRAGHVRGRHHLAGHREHDQRRRQGKGGHRRPEGRVRRAGRTPG